jgi:hypothetical protein
VAHSCNPNFPGGRDQEDGSLKPASVNSGDPSLEKPITKIRLVEWLEVQAQSSNFSTAK